LTERIPLGSYREQVSFSPTARRTGRKRVRPTLAGAGACVAAVLLLATACGGSGTASGTASDVGSTETSGSSSTGSSSTGSSSSARTVDSTSVGPSASTTARVPRPDHTVVVVLENHNFSSIIGNADQAHWLNGLPAAILTDWHGIAHPSQPNYLALFTGSTHGVTNDHCPVTVTGASLASQLTAAGMTFTGYSEALPGVGSTACRIGTYARKHNPWVDVAGLPASMNQPFTSFPTDYTKLPTVSFVIPDMCHDTHDCPIPVGDAWLKDNLGPYVTWAGSHNSLLVVTYDEGEGGAADNHIPLLLVGPMVAPGRYDTRGDQYSTLRTLEALHGLPPLGTAARRAPLTGVWR
jgi:phosphatidylinositol-3-phosphatase